VFPGPSSLTKLFHIHSPLECGIRVLWDGADEFTDVMIPFSMAIGSAENNVGSDVNFRVLVDSSIIEVFVNFGEQTKTLFAYPTKAESVSVGLLGKGCVFHSMEAWKMNPYEFDASLVM